MKTHPPPRLWRLWPTFSLGLAKGAGVFLFALGFWGCPTSTSNPPGDNSRHPTGLNLDQAGANHPYCDHAEEAFSSPSECRATQKFKVSWSYPGDTAGLIGFRLYLDTSATGSSPAILSWSDLVKRNDLTDLFIEKEKGPTDSVFFAIGTPLRRPDTVRADEQRIFRLDTTGRVPASGKITLGLIAVYRDDATSNDAVSVPTPLGDQFAPVLVVPEFETFARSIHLTWQRPLDITNFFDVNADTGVIAAYSVSVIVSGKNNIQRAKNFAPSLDYKVENETRLPTDTTAILNAKKELYGFNFSLPDGGHFHHGKTDAYVDILDLKIGNLTPLDTFEIQIIPVDAAGNRISVSTASEKIILTDTTEPVKPLLVADSNITQNQISFYWLPSRDSVDSDGDGKLEAGPVPDFGIREYELSRQWLRDSVVVSRKDTTIPAGNTNAAGRYADTLKYLPPGTPFRFVLTAIDSTKHRSQSDTLLIETEKVAFGDSGQNLVCPMGFSPLPGHSLFIGDTSGNASVDERTWVEPPSGFQRNFVAPFCMEPYEHRDDSGKFVHSVSWAQADSICAQISPEDSTRLCSEAQWERACKSTDSLALQYGYQDDAKQSSLLQISCNQGTGDSIPALNLSERDGRCLTPEGIFDMPGQFSEWVRDEYIPDAYVNLARDTLPYSFAFGDPRPEATHVFRGGSYFKPNDPPLSPAQIQSLARCSNRDTPRQVRPVFKPGCRDTIPKILVTYGSALDQHACFDLPGIPWREVQSLYPLPDSVHVVIISSGGSDTVDIANTANQGKRPLAVQLTTIALAAVEFVDTHTGDIVADTLAAQEFRDTTAGVWKKVLEREAGIGRVPRQVDGAYAVTFLYAYAQSGSRPAPPNFSSRSISFRCCAKPRVLAEP